MPKHRCNREACGFFFRATGRRPQAASHMPQAAGHGTDVIEKPFFEPEKLLDRMARCIIGAGFGSDSLAAAKARVETVDRLVRVDTVSRPYRRPQLQWGTVGKVGTVIVGYMSSVGYSVYSR